MPILKKHIFAKIFLLSLFSLQIIVVRIFYISYYLYLINISLESIIVYIKLPPTVKEKNEFDQNTELNFNENNVFFEKLDSSSTPKKSNWNTVIVLQTLILMTNNIKDYNI